MLTTSLIVLMAVALFAYVAMPLINPAGADPLPSDKDPLLVDLEEEKEALFRAIRELDERDDLDSARRDQLRARYEAKAAKVLRALDELTLAGGRAPRQQPRRRGRPWGALALLAMVGVISVSLSAFVLPRVGGGTVTTFFAEDLRSARELQALSRAADREPSAQNLLALADAYWRLDDAEGARDAYSRAISEAGAESALAYQRLGFLVLQEDPEQALEYLERAASLAPDDLDTLYAVGELNFAFGRFDRAKEAWQAFLDHPEGAGDELVSSRLALTEELQPLAELAAEDPSKENLLAYADVLWRHDERSRAVDAYFRVLTQHDPNEAVALGRTGQLMFTSGRNEDAIALMERAAMSDDVEPETLLFLGNAYFTEERYSEAISVWERHVALVGEESAGRVPSLIADARQRLAAAEGTAGASPVGEAVGEDESTGNAADAGAAGASPVQGAENAQLVAEPRTGATLFAEHCAACHGPAGQGGFGPRLAGSSRAANENNVSDAVRFGRGAMPGFAPVLSSEELTALIDYVTRELAGVAAGQ